MTSNNTALGTLLVAYIASLGAYKRDQGAGGTFVGARTAAIRRRIARTRTPKLLWSLRRKP